MKKSSSRENLIVAQKMPDVPSEIFREILLRLPAESLLRLRSVCKDWLRIIDDSSFIKAHTNNQLYSHTLVVRNGSGAPLYSFSLDSLKFVKGPQLIDATPIKQLIRRGVPLLRPLYMENPSCNGLVLISSSDTKKVWAIWNPLTKEFHELPQPNAGSKSYDLAGVGFGYDYEADDYKVVRIDKAVSGRKFVYQTLIYSLKSNSWRQIEDRPLRTYISGNYLNGTVYWVISEGDFRDEKIVALDLVTESYSLLPLPPVVIRSEIHKFDLHLESLDGCLICSLDYRRRHVLDGWVMKDNGAEKSWIKLFSLQYFSHMQYYVDKVSGILRLVAYLKREQQVLLQYDWGFLWFDIGNNSVLKFSIHGLPEITSSTICPGSLVRLSGRATGHGAVTATGTLTRKRKRKTKRKDTRLKLCVRNSWEKCCSDNHYCSEGSCRHCKEE